MNTLDILIKYHPAFLEGLKVTMQLSAIVWVTGLLLGTLLGIMGNKYPHEVGLPTRVLSFILGGIPILVFLFWLHYPVQFMLNVVIDPFYTAAFTFAIVNIFAVADIVRSALNDFPKQYITAAKVCGMGERQTFLSVQFPLIFREILPALLLLQVTMLHVTLFASLISVEEVFRIAQRINASIYKPVEIYTALGVLFLAISLPVNGFALWFKHKFTRDISES